MELIKREIGAIEFEVLVNGKPIKEFPHEGKIYVEGRKDSTYTLKVKNNSTKRILAIISVDGLSIMDGKKASHNSGGYVIESFSSIEIKGWRLDLDDVAKFIFGGVGESYAKKSGDEKNVGVIGCAIFTEKAKPVCKIPDFSLGASNQNSFSFDANLTKGASKESFNLGTGFGEATRQEVKETTFEKDPSPQFIFTIYYNDRKGLLAAGVDLKPKPQVVIPKPFPGQTAFCTPPQGYKRKA